MPTNERMTELGLAHATTGTSFWSTFARRGETLWRGVKNRVALNPLNEFEDYQLDDIGLSRSDVDRALNHTGIMDDPSRLLSAARQRARREFMATLER